MPSAQPERRRHAAGAPLQGTGRAGSAARAASASSLTAFRGVTTLAACNQLSFQLHAALDEACNELEEEEIVSGACHATARSFDVVSALVAAAVLALHALSAALQWQWWGTGTGQIAAGAGDSSAQASIAEASLAAVAAVAAGLSAWGAVAAVLRRTWILRWEAPARIRAALWRFDSAVRAVAAEAAGSGKCQVATLGSPEPLICLHSRKH